MIKDYMGILNLNESENDIRSLTTNRPIAAIPIGSRYRVIDFILSSMVNSGIQNVGIYSQSNSRSLVDHIGAGKPWNLDRKNDGLFLFTHSINDSVHHDAKMFKNNIEYIHRSKQQNVILASSYFICNIDFKSAIEQHENSGCDITAIYKKVDDADSTMLNCDVLNIDDENNVRGFSRNIGLEKSLNIGMEMFIMKKDLLLDLIYDCLKKGFSSNFKNIIYNNMPNLNIKAFEFTGYLSCVNSVKAYYKTNLDMLNPKVVEELFLKNNPIYTKIKDEPPTKYLKSSRVSNSLIADGSIVEGAVTNSLLSRYVVVKKGASINNCIILQNCVIKEGCTLSNVIIDKNVVIEKNTELKGTSSFPLVIEKRNVVDTLQCV